MLTELRRFSFSPLGRPVFDAFTRRSYRAAYALLMRTQWLSREELRRHQLAQLGQILTHAYAYSPFYRERLAAVGWGPGWPVDFELLASVPPLEREDLQERLDQISTISRFHFARVETITSGGTTTGQPAKIYSDGWSTDIRSAVWLRNGTWVGAAPESKLAVLGGNSLEVRQNSRSRDDLLALLKGRLRLPTWDLRDERLDYYADRLTAFRPEVLVFYPTSALHFARYLRSRGRALAIPILIAAAEATRPEWKDEIEAAFGGRYYESYGCNEFSHIAHGCADCGAIHVNDDRLILETHAGGQLLATDLANRATPLIRYRIGDVGVLSDEPAACGRGLASLASIEGRTLEIFTFGADGRSTVNTFVVLMKAFPQVRGYQVWQPDESRLQLLLAGADDSTAAEIGRRARANLDGVHLDVIPVDSIPVTAAGKRPLFIKGTLFTGQTTAPPQFEGQRMADAR
jgi:phenylacetate-CoA ligase